ncbi:MAG: bifunctional 4-hydroxy-2-oxoglutarate aldolase/2-dehydro-3-deoxy-phosphogluconate aldolase [Oscillospiraceae bacterium]|nr:bifunctional 4-hydroxy-2-oxoglutarate aldolase/2-dehydro-3-deoxy-phosphogluconate aldolase [Oscillospiraceae bacterium]
MKNKNIVETISQIKENKIIAIIRGVSEEKIIPLCQALYDGGIRLVELTYSANKHVSDEQTAKQIKMLSTYFEGKLYVGAGTVITKKQVAYTKKAGGNFIISPNTDKKIIKATKRKGLVSIPGALTPSEALNAKIYGADFVKLFPINNLGVNYFKAVSVPLSHIDFIAVGGIDLNNMHDYLNANISGFGIGANITNKQMIENNDWPAIRKLAESYTAVIKNG